MSRRYSNEEFKEAVATSTSIRQVLKKLGLKPAGGNYQSCHNLIKELNIKFSHFRGCAWRKGLKSGPKRPLSDYLNNKYGISSNRLRIRLIKEGYFKPTCSNCKQTQWLSKPIPLELDHINGNHKDNTLSNLRLLCPNCHALTPNYRGKNISN